MRSLKSFSVWDWGVVVLYVILAGAAFAALVSTTKTPSYSGKWLFIAAEVVWGLAAVTIVALKLGRSSWCGVVLRTVSGIECVILSLTLCAFVGITCWWLLNGTGTGPDDGSGVLGPGAMGSTYVVIVDPYAGVYAGVAGLIDKMPGVRALEGSHLLVSYFLFLAIHVFNFRRSKAGPECGL